MRKSFVAPVVLVAALALTAPPATAAPASSADDTVQVDARKAKKGLKVKRSAKGYHSGMKPVKITVSGAGQGKAKFFIGKKKRKTKKLKRGKAAWKMPKHLAPGKYTVRVKVGKRQGKTKVKVHNSQLQVNAVEFTVSASGRDFPEISGAVTWKGKPAGKGYVDFYKDGKNKKGNKDNPNYLAFGTVSGGQFVDRSSIRTLVERFGVGSHVIQGFYTPTPSWDEYVHSTPITVHVVP